MTDRLTDQYVLRMLFGKGHLSKKGAGGGVSAYQGSLRENSKKNLRRCSFLSIIRKFISNNFCNVFDIKELIFFVNRFECRKGYCNLLIIIDDNHR